MAPILLSIGLISFLFCQLALAAKRETAPFIPKGSSVLQITQENVQSRVYQKRSNQLSAVLLCPAGKNKKTCASLIEGEWNKVAQSLQGISNIGAVDCDANKDVCKSLHPNGAVIQQATVIIFPLLPVPIYEYKGDITTSGIKKEVARYYQADEITKISKENVHEFISSFPLLPKALLFTDKENIPFIYRAISKSFPNKLKFGLVKSDNNDLVARWKVKSFPHLMVLRTGSAPSHYSGKMSYLPIFDWINIFSETFAGDVNVTGGSKEEKYKPWEYERIPELTGASNKDLCFKKGAKGFCVVYLKEGAALSEEEIMMFEEFKNRFRSHLSDRGTELRWMWMNVNIESEFKNFLDRKLYPSVVVFNPRRKRYIPLENGKEATKKSIENLLDTVLGGGARFTGFSELPKFADRKQSNSPPKSTDEL